MVEIAERNERRVDPRRFGHRVAYEIAGTIAQHGIAAARHGGRDMPPVAGHEQVGARLCEQHRHPRHGAKKPDPLRRGRQSDPQRDPRAEGHGKPERQPLALGLQAPLERRRQGAEP